METPAGGLFTSARRIINDSFLDSDWRIPFSGDFGIVSALVRSIVYLMSLEPESAQLRLVL